MPKLIYLLSAAILVLNNLSTPPAANCDHDPVVADLLAETRQNRWIDWIAHLSGEQPVQTAKGEGRILSRSSYVLFEPDQIPSAFNYLQEELANMGYVKGKDFEVHTYDFPYAEKHAERNWKNLVLTLPGSDPERQDERVLLVAHLDSTSDQERSQAPGADDNASGSAGLMEAAEVLRRFSFERTIHLIWFSGEEQSRRGSEHFVEDYADWLPEIVGVVNLDMFAFDWDNDRCFEVHAGTLPGSQQIGSCIQSVIEAYDLDLRFDFIDDESAYKLSDHYPFWLNDVPAVMVFENGFYQAGETCGNADRNYSYHTTADTLTYINQETGFSILQASMATAAHMAQPVGQCFSDTVQVDGYSDLERMYLKWEQLENAASYQVWVGEGDQQQFLGETPGTQWVYPLLGEDPAGAYQVVALSSQRCQSEPGNYTRE